MWPAAHQRLWAGTVWAWHPTRAHAQFHKADDPCAYRVDPGEDEKKRCRHHQESRTQAPHLPQATKSAEDRQHYGICDIIKEATHQSDIHQKSVEHMYSLCQKWSNKRMYTVFKVFHFHRYINKWIRNAATITCKNLIGNSYDHVLQSPSHMLKRCEFLHTRNNKVSSTGVLGNPLKHRHRNNSRKNEAAIRIASF